MALTITNAHDLNDLLRWTLGLARLDGAGPDAERARAAGVRLADCANKTLGAGVNGADIEKAWPETGSPPAR